MKVRKLTIEQEQQEKEEYFRSLSGEERLRMMRILNDRLRKPGVDYELRNKKVKVTRLS
ncbi:MAG: hypothetical protein KF725_05450 [Cyclobacteriaceae bacterium]|nr:hypothetical protein [Cyclobacteriaceae bacterium]UYN85920.1 MAG: hypothetical protein KIT51_13730 [Cyclobacteriaceae bacterium]